MRAEFNRGRVVLEPESQEEHDTLLRLEYALAVSRQAPSHGSEVAHCYWSNGVWYIRSLEVPTGLTAPESECQGPSLRAVGGTHGGA